VLCRPHLVQPLTAGHLENENRTPSRAAAPRRLHLANDRVNRGTPVRLFGATSILGGNFRFASYTRRSVRTSGTSAWGRYGAFPEPSANVRCLREADGRCRRKGDIARPASGRLNWAETGPSALLGKYRCPRHSRRSIAGRNTLYRPSRTLTSPRSGRRLIRWWCDKVATNHQPHRVIFPVEIRLLCTRGRDTYRSPFPS
jgi:hypothetical protein